MDFVCRDPDSKIFDWRADGNHPFSVCWSRVNSSTLKIQLKRWKGRNSDKDKFISVVFFSSLKSCA